MKKLVVFYSFEGNTKLIAEHIAKTAGADILELRPKKDISTKGFMKFFWGGKAVMRNEIPELEAFGKDPLQYDLLFIGTPVWAWSFAPVLKAFFSKDGIKGKKIALFCCHGGGKGKIFEKMKKSLEGNEFAGEADFLEPLKKNTAKNLDKAGVWARQIVIAEGR